MSAEKQGQEDIKIPADHRVRDKVAIVGFAGHKDQAPWESEEFELWGINELYDHAPWQQAQQQGRLRWFEIHTRDVRDESNPFVMFRHSRNTDHAQKLAALNCPVYMQRHWEDIPMSVEYPLQRILEKFGNYFTNSISYEIALAIDMGFKEIHVYGVDMAQGTEYSDQRPSCEYFLGWAKALGIKTYLPPESDLLKAPYMYGWEQHKADAMKIKFDARRGELKKRRDELGNQHAQIVAMINKLDGAIEDTEYYHGVWSGL